MTIKKKGNQWCVESESGKNLGCSDSEDGAHKRLAQVEYFKHAHKSLTLDDIITGIDEKSLIVGDEELVSWAYEHKSELMEKGLTFPGIERKGLFTSDEFTPPSFTLDARQLQGLLFGVFAGTKPPSLQMLTYAEAYVPTADRGIIVIDDSEHCFELTVKMQNAGPAVIDAQSFASQEGGHFDPEDAFSSDLIQYLKGRPLSTLIEVRPLEYNTFNDGAEFVFQDGTAFCVYVRGLQKMRSTPSVGVSAPISGMANVTMDVYLPPIDGGWAEEKAFASDACLTSIRTGNPFYSGVHLDKAVRLMNESKFAEAAQDFLAARDAYDQGKAPAEWKCLNTWAQYAEGLTLPPKAVGT